jgi:hypothetical protein
MTEHAPDKFEIVARKWTAQEGLVESAREFEELYDLDPALVEGLEEAIREDDVDLILEALVTLLRAVREEAGGLDKAS